MSYVVFLILAVVCAALAAALIWYERNHSPAMNSERADWAAQRARQWGPAGLFERIGAGYLAFLEPITRADDPWLTVVTGAGRDAIDAVYGALLDGTVPAREGHILSV